MNTLALDLSWNHAGIAFRNYSSLTTAFTKLDGTSVVQKYQSFSTALQSFLKNNKVDRIRIESPLKRVIGGNIDTIIKLNNITAMAELYFWINYKKEVEFINCKSVRSKVGIKVKRGDDIKEAVLDHVDLLYPDLKLRELPKYKRYDIADAVLLTLLP